MKKTVLFQITGIAARQKFGLPIHDRNDEHIAARRTQQGVTDGLLVSTTAPCHTQFLMTDLQRAGLFLVDAHVMMGGANGRTPTLTLTFSDQGEPFKVTDELQREFDLWVIDSIRRHWKSGQIYKNADNIAVRVVGASKPSGRSQGLSLKELLSGDWQPAQLTS